MALNQFGAIMTHAIELEQSLEGFYTEAAQALGSHADELKARAKAAGKRAKKLQRSRQMDVTEMTLEIIEGLDEADYAIDTDTYTADNINALEEKVVAFYTDAAPKINVRESRRLLERCAKEHSGLSSL